MIRSLSHSPFSGRDSLACAHPSYRTVLKAKCVGCLRRAFAVGLLSLAPGLCVPAGLAQSVTTLHNVTTQQYDNSRSGVQSAETILTPSNVNTTSFGKLFSLPVSGHVYAQPLYMAGLTMGDGTTHNVLFVATEQDYVYALDADGNNPAQGYLWRDFLVGAGETCLSYKDFGGYSIYPDIGITSTPVIDPATGTIYVVTRSKTTTGTGTVQYMQRIHALNLVDGTEKMNGPTVIQATVPGTAGGGTTISFDPLLGNQRTGLLLAPTPGSSSAASVFIAWASLGDNGPYHGWVMSYNAADLSQQTGVWADTPNGAQGGIWEAGGGLSSDGKGNIFIASGNGTFDVNSGGPDYGESAVSLAITGTTLAPNSFFTPTNQSNLSAVDNDMGTSSVMLLPKQSGSIPDLAVTADKSGNIYLLNSDSLGGFSATGNPSVQSFNIGYSILTSPAFFNNTLYLAGEAGPLSAWTFNPATELFSTTPISSSAAIYGCNDCGGAGTTPVISANGTTNAIVWALDNSGREKRPAILRAYDPLNMQNVLYSSDQAANNLDAAAISVKFTSPVVVNGQVYVGGVNAVTVYGETATAPTVSLTATPSAILPGSSSTLNVTAANVTAVTVTGSDGSSVTLPPTGGTQTVTPATTTTYTATGTGSIRNVVSAATVTVSSTPGACAPTSPGVSICAPTNNASTGTTVTLIAGALAQSGNIVAIRAYIDNVAVFTVNNPTATASFQITQTVTVSAGYHGLVVVGYQSTGGTVQTSSIFTAISTTPTLGITATAASILLGGSSTLSISATNVTTITVTGTDGTSFTLPSTGGAKVVSPTTTTTYTANAMGSSGSTTVTASVTVVVAPSGCIPSAPGVSICAPTNNAMTGSTVTITAGALALSGNIAALRAYIDNVAVFTVPSPSATKSFQTTQSVNVASGYHRLVVVGYQSTGGYVFNYSEFTTPGTGCVPPAPGAMICSPTNNSTSVSPGQISAGATASSGYITAIRVYVDNVAQVLVTNPQQSPSFSINQAISMTGGTHNVVVVCYQSTGGAVKASAAITIQ